MKYLRTRKFRRLIVVSHEQNPVVSHDYCLAGIEVEERAVIVDKEFVIGFEIMLYFHTAKIINIHQMCNKSGK